MATIRFCKSAYITWLSILAGLTSTPYAKPKWEERLGGYVPTRQDLIELERATWLEF